MFERIVLKNSFSLKIGIDKEADFFYSNSIAPVLALPSKQDAHNWMM